MGKGSGQRREGKWRGTEGRPEGDGKEEALTGKLVEQEGCRLKYPQDLSGEEARGGRTPRIRNWPFLKEIPDPAVFQGRCLLPTAVQPGFSLPQGTCSCGWGDIPFPSRGWGSWLGAAICFYS